MDEIEAEFIELAVQQSSSFSIIVCLYTGEKIPSNCAPMLRSPQPKIGMPLNSGFSKHFAEALSLNPAVHDGAVMVGRRQSSEQYNITGWSFRLFPPPTQVIVKPNRGSAFNSCLEMSAVGGVDRLYLFSRGDLFRFEHGDECQVELNRPHA